MNFKGKDYIIHMPQYLPGMDKQMNNFASEELGVFIAFSSSIRQSMVNGRHLSHRRN